MSLIATATVRNGDGAPRREYYVDPKPGMFNAVCVDVIDHGFNRNNYGKVTRKIQFAFQLENTITEKMIVAAKTAKGLPAQLDDEDRELIGTRLFIRGKKMSLSLFPGGDKMKSSDLYSFLEDWNGERFTKPTKDKPLEVDLESFIGKNAAIMISRTPDKNDPKIVYSNIVSIMPQEEDASPLTVDESYTRVKDRENYTAPPTEADIAEVGSKAKATAAPVEEDVDIPYDA